jgi:KRAB domain-containing zinc finger protein
LKRHIKLHTGERNVMWYVKNWFSRSSSLNEHQRVHICEKPYKCDVSEKNFYQLIHLNTHQRLHTGKKPYKREVCEKSFSHSGSLIRHRRVHSG